MILPAYRYAAAVMRVVDGDTVELMVDVGFRFTHRSAFRLFGINCPELNTDEGKAARDWTSLWCAQRTSVIAETYKNPEKYGRWLARIIDPDSGQCLNDELVNIGHAQPYAT